MSKFGQKIDLPYTGSLLPPTYFFLFFFFFIFDTIKENKYADIETRLSMKERKDAEVVVFEYNITIKIPNFLFFLTNKKKKKKKKKKNTCRCY